MKVNERLFHGETAALRRHAAQILGAAIAAADPAAAVHRTVRRAGDRLTVADRTYDLGALSNLFVVGAGKASARMAAALESLVGDRVTAGVVTTKRGYVERLRNVDLVEAGHPLPDQAGLEGARRIVDLVRAAGAGDLVLVLISGGGSALLPMPADGISLEEKIAATDLLLRSGATINEVNAVRKHLSRVKGGWLARHASPATVVTLILSDVLGNPLDVIASGPTVPDPTTFCDALTVVDRCDLRARLPAAVRGYLELGASGAAPETPKPGDRVFDRAQTAVIGDITLAAAAAADRARALGYQVDLRATNVQGEAREVGARFGQMIREMRMSMREVPRPTCVIMGGETTVTVLGRGRGGRNQELALGAASGLDGLSQTLVAACGTDGTDGPTDAAGAVVDGTTLERARAAGLDPMRALADNDAYAFFEALGDLIVSGPTNTNVNDLWLGLMGKAPDAGPG